MAACLGALALFLTGCSSMGPSTVSRDRFDYSAAISESWKRQMLLNLLKIRYVDAPVFLDVGSVINSYSLAGEVSLTGQAAGEGRGDQFAAVGITGKYEDRPTITYSPLTGDKFARSMMAPIPVSSIMYLVQSGYPADRVLRLTVNAINGLENAFGGPTNPRPGNPAFFELLEALRSTQNVGWLGMRVRQTGDRQAVAIELHPETDPSLVESKRTVSRLLKVNPQSKAFTVVYGSFPGADDEIAILSRSMLQVMVDIASYIDVPAADVDEGRVYIRAASPPDKTQPPLIRVRQGEAPPRDAYVATRYRERWFWIEDRDVPSKTVFSFLMFMFALTETGEAQSRAPVVTVPAR